MSKRERKQAGSSGKHLSEPKGNSGHSAQGFAAHSTQVALLGCPLLATTPLGTHLDRSQQHLAPGTRIHPLGPLDMGVNWPGETSTSRTGTNLYAPLYQTPGRELSLSPRLYMGRPGSPTQSILGTSPFLALGREDSPSAPLFGAFAMGLSGIGHPGGQRESPFSLKENPLGNRQYSETFWPVNSVFCAQGRALHKAEKRGTRRDLTPHRLSYPLPGAKTRRQTGPSPQEHAAPCSKTHVSRTILSPRRTGRDLRSFTESPKNRTTPAEGPSPYIHEGTGRRAPPLRRRPGITPSGGNQL